MARTQRAMWEVLARGCSYGAVEVFVIVYLRTVTLTVSSFDRVSSLVFFTILATIPADVAFRYTTTKKVQVKAHSVVMAFACMIGTILISMTLDFPNGSVIAFWLLGLDFMVYLAIFLLFPIFTS